MNFLKRWSVYLGIFLLAVFLTNQYRVYEQYREFEAAQKEIAQQEADYQKKCIKNALFYEARGEGIQGILAVASIIENRKNNPKYPATYCGVIKQSNQFSYTSQSRPDVETVEHRLISSDKQAYVYVSDVASKMLEGSFKVTLPETTLWYTKYTVKNYWTKTKKVVTRIGQHVFYKDTSKRN